MLINTPMGKKSQYDDYAMRRAAITHKHPVLYHDVSDERRV